MPLSGDPKKDIPKLIEEGRDKDQAVAIAMSEEERRKKDEPVKKIDPDETKPEIKKYGNGFYKSASI